MVISGVVGSQSGRLSQALLGEPIDTASTLEAASKSGTASHIFLDVETAHAVVEEFSLLSLDSPDRFEIKEKRNTLL